MLSDIIEGILKFIFRVFAEIICFYTGEIILYILTFGRKKPRWDYYLNASPTKFIILTEISFWIGFFFWIFLIGWIARFFF
jgi:hypothetical protein